MNGPEGFLPKNQNFMTQVARIPWYRPKSKLLHQNLHKSTTCNEPSMTCIMVTLNFAFVNDLQFSVCPVVTKTISM